MNGMGEEGAKALGHALTHNQCLLELNISQNRISEQGALHISRGLLINDVLETLRVSLYKIIFLFLDHLLNVYIVYYYFCQGSYVLAGVRMFVSLLVGTLECRNDVNQL